ncbi:MAG: hypothetical protein L6R00_18535 [Phycisphaerae bacterium]|nr:hypothetical protein [Phycisphaerae bacterium]
MDDADAVDGHAIAGDAGSGGIDARKEMGRLTGLVIRGTQEQDVAAAKRNRKRAGAVTLKIPAELYQRLGRMIEGTGFRSVTEFATFVLRDLAAGGAIRPEEGHGLTQREVDLVRQRLKALGYLE